MILHNTLATIVSIGGFQIDIALVAGLAGVGVSIATALYYVVNIRRTLKQVLNDTTQLRVETTRLGIQQNGMLVQQRRLAEHNLHLSTTVSLLYRSATPSNNGPSHERMTAEAFVAGQMRLDNVGDGPLDILACLVAGRELSSAHGARIEGRDVRWESLVSYYWNRPPKGADSPQDMPTTNDLQNDKQSNKPLFVGLSTTRPVPYAADQLVRLDPKEGETLTRIDGVTNVGQLDERGQINLVYKVFTVALSYPLGEIARQAGVSPEQISRDEDTFSLYALDLARPNYHRWARIQRALFVINRFTFRLALDGLERREGMLGAYYAEDPLGYLADPNAWRCFLLHHWDFAEQPGAAPLNADDPYGERRREAEHSPNPYKTSEQIKDDIRALFGIHTLENEESVPFVRARDYCVDHLPLLLEAWRELNQVITRCNQPNFGFSDLIKEPKYAARWQALKHEGYLLSHPDGHSVPSDELAYERYSIRVRYVLGTTSTLASTM